MNEIVLVVGGSRSGKSDYAQEYAESIEQQLFFLATCPPGTDDDPEMRVRISRHQENRRGKGWQTREEQVDLVPLIKELPAQATILIDCLTLWVSNLLYAARHGSSLSDVEMTAAASELMNCCRDRAGTVILVSSEVGCGVVPENPLARRYRDLMGRCNRIVAEIADRVVLVSCGIPMVIKG